MTPFVELEDFDQIRRYMPALFFICRQDFGALLICEPTAEFKHHGLIRGFESNSLGSVISEGRYENALLSQSNWGGVLNHDLVLHPIALFKMTYE